MKMIAANPHSLLLRGSVIDYSGRTIDGVTPLQCAYGAQDAAMCNMITTCIQQLENGEQVAAQQLQEQVENKQWQAALNEEYFAELAATITQEKFVADKLSATTDAAVSAFRETVKPGLVKTINHFNIQTLINAVRVYRTCHDNWNHNQRSLYWRQIIGYLQRLVPACYAQDLCQGLHNVVSRQASPERSLKLFFHHLNYYPLATNPGERMGYDFAIYSDQVIDAGLSRMCFPNQTMIPCRQRASLMLQNLEKLLLKRMISMQTLYQDLQQPQTRNTRCVIC
jgi:hypothetical protein